MKIKYDFVDGTMNEIEVDEELGEVLVDLNRLQYNNNQAETRRHRSLQWLMDLGLDYPDATDISEIVIQNDEISILRKAIASLLPQQKELLNKVFIEGRSIASIAREQRVNEAAIRDRLKKIYSKLRKFL